MHDDPHIQQNRPVAGFPGQQGNQQDALGPRERRRIGDNVVQFHRKGIRKRRYHDLTAEKYLIHIDGEGDAQWADLYQGERISIPPNITGTPRVQENLLRPIVDNAVAYHTTQPLRFVVDSRQDRESRQSALVDQAFANYVTKRQRLNSVFAEAFYIACAFGNCPVHAFWRDDIASDPYEPLYAQADQQMQQAQMQAPRRGFIDAWVGDPWDTIYHSGSRRGSVQMLTYGRVLPIEMVKNAYSHLPNIDNLEGSTTLPSSSRFQRTLRKWYLTGQNTHGSATMIQGQNDEELIAVLCREIAPGISTDWPNGRLTIVALKGTAATDDSESGGGYGEPMLLHDGPLPAGRFSQVRVYSHHRFDDVLGKPFVADLDDLQIRLNQLLSLREEYLRRSVRAPLITSGAVTMDTAHYEDDAILEVDPASQFMPNYLEIPIRQNSILSDAIEETRQAIYTLGGYQAASRGESHSGDAAAKVIALARADDTIHGPTNQRFRETVEEFMGLCWSLAKDYMDVPWLVDIVGDDYDHLADPYIDRTRLSEEPPAFRLVSGFGATSEARGQQLLSLVQTTGADGKPLMTTEQFQEAWPDQSIYPEHEDAQAVRERRARVINTKIRRVVKQVQERMGEGAQAFVQEIHNQLLRAYPLLPDDLPVAHVEALALLTQDEDENQMVRQIAGMRQALYMQWLQTQMMPPAPPAPTGTTQQSQGPPPSRVAEAATTPGGTTTSEGLRPSPGQVQNLTEAAQGMR